MILKPKKGDYILTPEFCALVNDLVIYDSGEFAICGLITVTNAALTELTGKPWKSALMFKDAVNLANCGKTLEELHNFDSLFRIYSKTLNKSQWATLAVHLGKAYLGEIEMGQMEEGLDRYQQKQLDQYLSRFDAESLEHCNWD